MPSFPDRLADAVRRHGPLCVGIDPRWELMPRKFRAHWPEDLKGSAAAMAEFCVRVVDLVADLVPVVKPQSAFFEAFGPHGMEAQGLVLDHARRRGLLTILDAKRNDIASTAQAYAEAAFVGSTFDGRHHPIWDADALTINPYLGRDSVEPFLACARKVNAGIYVLVRTSNQGAGLFQDLRCDGKPIYQHVAEAVERWTRENLGACGYGDVGAVVGATHPREMEELRRLIPSVPFLVPGYGAQGGSAADTAAAFRADGLGAVVNSSRGIMAAFKPDDLDWEEKIVAATRAAVAELRAATPMRNLCRK